MVRMEDNAHAEFSSETQFASIVAQGDEMRTQSNAIALRLYLPEIGVNKSVET